MNAARMCQTIKLKCNKDSDRLKVGLVEENKTSFSTST